MTNGCEQASISSLPEVLQLTMAELLNEVGYVQG